MEKNSMWMRLSTERALKESKREMNLNGVAIFDFDSRATIALWMILQHPGKVSGRNKTRIHATAFQVALGRNSYFVVALKRLLLLPPPR